LRRKRQRNTAVDTEAAVADATLEEVRLTSVLQAVCFAPLFVLSAGIVMQRIVAL
jgi:hypothetical protein